MVSETTKIRETAIKEIWLRKKKNLPRINTRDFVHLGTGRKC